LEKERQIGPFKERKTRKSGIASPETRGGRLGKGHASAEKLRASWPVRESPKMKKVGSARNVGKRQKAGGRMRTSACSGGGCLWNTGAAKSTSGKSEKATLGDLRNLEVMPREGRRRGSDAVIGIFPGEPSVPSEIEN